MSAHTVTLRLPAPLYERLRERAEESHRSLESELLEVVAAVVPVPEELPSELGEAVEALNLLSDEELLQAARSRMSGDSAARLEELNRKRQSVGLDEDEARDLARLLQIYEKTMLVRSQAAKLLHQRGHRLSPESLGG